MADTTITVTTNDEYEPSISEAVEQDLVKILGAEMGKDAQQITIQDLAKLLEYYNKYYEELNKVLGYLHELDDNMVNLREKYIKDRIGFNKEGMPPSANYILFREIQKNKGFIEDTLKKGYSLINFTRQFFTNEKIIYEVGIQRKRKGEAVIKNFEIEEKDLLKMTHLNYEHSASRIEDLLKLNVTSYGKVMRDKQEMESIVNEQLNGKQTIWGKVTSVLTNEQYQPRLNNKKVNRGFIYEAYKRILEDRGRKNKNSVNLTPQEIINAYEAVTHTNFLQSAFYSGGDYLNRQYKLLSARPQVVTMKTLVLFVNNFRKQLTDFIKTQDSKAFIDYLQSTLLQTETGKSILSQAAKESQSEAKEAIKETILSITS